MPIQVGMNSREDIRILSFREDREARRSTMEVQLPSTLVPRAGGGGFPDMLGTIEEQLSDQLGWLRGLRADVEHLNAGLHHLSSAAAADDPGHGQLLATLSALLVRRLSGEDSRVESGSRSSHHTIRLAGRGHLVHSFSLLYSLSLFQSYWRSGLVEPRLVEMLELADLFFRTGTRLDSPEQELRGELGQGFTQEALNSFINFLNPDPDRSGNLGIKILLLEDNRDLAEIICDMLASYSYVACPAYDGLAGLDRLERESFDLIVSDIQMPRLDGMGLLRMLNNLKLEIPVILMTGYASIWQEQQVLQEGAAGYLQKPFGMKDLLQSVEKALTTSLQSRINGRAAQP